MLLALSAAPANDASRQSVQVAQVTIREQILVRVPMRLRQVPPASQSLIDWEEKRGPKCIATNSILGATLLGQRSVDLILRDRTRVRAKLENSCPALDFYYGFYLSRNADGQICSDRDFIRSRVGGECEIERFRTLEPARD